MGLVFKQFGWTAVIAVLASLVVARLLTPMMAAYFLRPHQGATQTSGGQTGPPDLSRDGPLMRAYMALMQWCLHHRLVTMLAALALFVGSLMLVPLLPRDSFPAADREPEANVELPPGSAAAQTRDMAEQVRRAILADDEIRTVVNGRGRRRQRRQPHVSYGCSRSAARYAHRCDHAAA